MFNIVAKKKVWHCKILIVGEHTVEKVESLEVKKVKIQRGLTFDAFKMTYFSGLIVHFMLFNSWSNMSAVVLKSKNVFFV